MCRLRYDQACAPDGENLELDYAGPCVAIEYPETTTEGPIDCWFPTSAPSPPPTEPDCWNTIVCPMDLDEVCGSDGMSHPNECFLKASITCGETPAGTTVTHHGPCEIEPELKFIYQFL